MNDKHPKDQVLDCSVVEELQSINELPCKIKRQNYSIIKVSGTDAPQFLQGQLTGDCNALEPEHSLLMAWCTPNGRVQNLVHVIRGENLFFLLIPKEQTTRMLKRLKMFVLRSDVKIINISADYVLFLTFNSNVTAPSLATLGQQDTLCWWVISKAKATDLWNEISAREISEAVLELHAIMSGIPYLPDELNGLSFSKGCYPGQEIIARVKYRGKVKRHLVKIDVFSSHEIPPATRLFDKSNVPVGVVLRSVTNSKNTHQLLAVLNLGVSHILLPTIPEAVLKITPLHA
jgi:folate-binding protein YgfZ